MARPVSKQQVAQLRTIVHQILDQTADEPDRSELATAARTVCALLALRFPGGSVELRVPPVAAVQLGIGERGRHTRGTPPNVVQTDATTLLRLASGDLDWEQARQARLVQASGIYAEVAQLWPLPELS